MIQIYPPIFMTDAFGNGWQHLDVATLSMVFIDLEFKVLTDFSNKILNLIWWLFCSHETTEWMDKYKSLNVHL